MALDRLSFMPTLRVSALWWPPVAVGLVLIDVLTGPYFQFPAVYIIPVTLAAWLSGFTAGLTLAIILPATRMALMLTLWGEPWDATTIVATFVTRSSVFVLMALMAGRLAQHERALIREVAVLSSLLPICEDCRQIRSGSDQWEPLDVYVTKRQGEFTTGLCPSCSRTRFPEHFPPA